jgi:putative oxidoreductase
MAEQPRLHESTRTEHIGHTGVYPVSGPQPASNAPLREQGAFAHPEERASTVAAAARSRAERGAWMVGRALFGGFFLFNGINHFLKHDMLVQYASSKGVPRPEVAVLGSGALLIAGGLSLITGTQPKAGAALVASFLVGVTPAMHNFWSADESSRMHEFVNFTKNIALIGGAALAAALPEPWPASMHMPASSSRALVARR